LLLAGLPLTLPSSQGATEWRVIRDEKHRFEAFAVAEPSGLAIVDCQVFVANDRPPRDRTLSQVVRIGRTSLTGENRSSHDVRHESASVLAQVRKIEDLAVHPGKPGEPLVFGITAFNRHEPRYNHLFFWSPTNPGRCGLVAAPGYRDVRTALLDVLKDSQGTLPARIKIEGLAIASGGQVFIGVRVAGARTSSFVRTILSGEIAGSGTSFALSDLSVAVRDVVGGSSSFRGVANPSEQSFWNEHAVSFGVSALCFDATRNRLYIMLSYEPDNPALVRSALWVSDLENGVLQPAKLVVIDWGARKSTLFGNKVEGVSIAPSGELVLICDDDDRRNLDGWTRDLREARVFLLQGAGD
jgi:hypothetical protein